jgi:hypothetical protein
MKVSKDLLSHMTLLCGTIIAFKCKSPPFVFHGKVNARERITISHHMEIKAMVQNMRKETMKP